MRKKFTVKIIGACPPSIAKDVALIVPPVLWFLPVSFLALSACLPFLVFAFQPQHQLLALFNDNLLKIICVLEIWKSLLYLVSYAAFLFVCGA